MQGSIAGFRAILPAIHRSLHRGSRRHDLDLGRLADPVLRDHGDDNRRGHPRSDAVAADLLDGDAGMPRDADTTVAADGDDMQRQIEAAVRDELADEREEAFFVGR
jgi:hypothetical protein